MKFTRIFVFIFSFLICIMCTKTSMAQLTATEEPFAPPTQSENSNPSVEGGPGDIDPGCDPDLPQNLPPCPIDGGVAFLLAAGIGLAGRRAHRQKKIKSSLPSE